MEDRLARYTEDLLAERRPDLEALTAGLGDEKREQLLAALVVVRRLKAAHRDAPPLAEDFLRSLDAHVREEIARVAPAMSGMPARADAIPAHGSVAGPPLTIGRRLRETGGALLRALTPRAAVGRWRLATVAVVVLACVVQIQVVRQVHRLEEETRALHQRLEQLGAAPMSPLRLPGRGELSSGEPGGETRRSATIDALLAGLEFRRKVEQRVQALQRELATKTGDDRRIVAALLDELRMLLRP